MVKHTGTESVALDVMMRRQQREKWGVPRIDGALSAQARAADCRAGNPVAAPRVRRNPDA
jgi:hypothetical protein